MRAMKAWKSTPDPILSIRQVPQAAQRTQDQIPLGRGDNQASDNWAGWVNTGGNNTNYGAQADFIAPNVGAPCNAGLPAVMAIWTGMGGDGGDNNLIQSGIAVGEGLGGPTVWQAWWELVATGTGLWPPVELTDNTAALSIHPDDSIYSKTYYNPGNDSALFYLEDVTTGVAASFTATGGITGPPSSYYDGTTADFILEFPHWYAGGQQGFAPFQQFAFVNSEAFNYSGSWATIGTYPRAQVGTSPYFNSGPLGADGASFAVGWQRCP
ncbi:MAG: G1 family glutamic endopeptidase [Acidimicrobiales bacterium]